MRLLVTTILVLTNSFNSVKSECEIISFSSSLNELRMKYFEIKGHCPCEPCEPRNREYPCTDTERVIEVSQNEIPICGTRATQKTNSASGLRPNKILYHAPTKVDSISLIAFTGILMIFSSIYWSAYF